MAPVIEVSGFQPLIEMQFAWPPVVVESIRNVGVLLDLTDGNTRADGVDRACRNEIGFAGAHGNPTE